jgi:hypothetical protein
MATIKIDRGFTQKIQQKGLTHSIGAPLPPPHKPKRRQGVRTGLVVSVVGIGAVALVIVISLAATHKSGEKKKQTKPVPAVIAGQALKQTESKADAQAAIEPVDDMDIYRQYDEKLKNAPPKPAQATPPAAHITAVPSGQGLLVEYWDNALCSSLDDLRKQSITRKRPPDETRVIADFDLPTSRAEHYVARVTGFLAPEETGDYVFFVASDDNGEFWLSPDEHQEKIRLCVKCDYAVGHLQWDKERRKSDPVRLEKGRRYALKGLLREGERGDHLAVAWSLASKNEPHVITSEFLVPSSVVWKPPQQ